MEQHPIDEWLTYSKIYTDAGIDKKLSPDFLSSSIERLARLSDTLNRSSEKFVKVLLKLLFHLT